VVARAAEEALQWTGRPDAYVLPENHQPIANNDSLQLKPFGRLIMRLLTFRANEGATLGLQLSSYIVDLKASFALMEAQAPSGLPALPGDMRSFLEAGEPAWLAARKVQEFMLDSIGHGRQVGVRSQPQALYNHNEVTMLAPISNPHKMLFLGLNYAEHITETGKQATTVPTIFAKYDNSIIGPGQPIVLPKVAADHIDLEAELAIVIGKPGKSIPLDQAVNHIAGYTVINDVSARELQKSQTQWVMSKSPDTFCPMGPYLVTPDEIDDPQNLPIRSWLNGESMQNSNTSHMIFQIPFLVHHISQLMTLQPGDIISTGTPPGVGYVRKPPIYLRPGDTVRVDVEGIGSLENPVLAEE
jgi:acylpyruvate hydrolase